jgi:hypothetical protein
LRERLIRACETHLGVHFYRVRVRPLDLPAPGRAAIPEHIEIRRADLEELQDAAADPELGISRPFLDGALGRGDRCYAAFDEGRIVSYVWRSTAVANHEVDVGVAVSPPYVYGYKGFTRPTHRGLALNVALVAFAGRDYLSSGYTHLAAFVALYNMASLANSRENGFAHIGYAGYVRWLGRVFPFRTGGPRRIGFRFVAGAA